MMKKLRIALAASLLTAALVSNANAFTTDRDAAFNPSRANLCYVYWNGIWFPVWC